MKDGGLECYDCRKAAPSFMVLESIWRAAFPDYQEVKSHLQREWPGTETSHKHKRHVGLCLFCLERRLGRVLTKTDFDLGLPINQGILWGAMMEWRPWT
jgi:hypothetical protein